MELPIKVQRIFYNKHWHECYLSWLRELYNHSRSADTLYTHSRTLMRFFADTRRNPGIGYDRMDVETFIEHSDTGKPIAVSTRNRRLAVLTSFYNHALKFRAPYRGKMRPLMRNVPPTLGIPYFAADGEDRDISDEEVQRFFKQIPRDSRIGKRDLALFLCYVSTARRRREITSLLWRDIEEVTFADGRPGWLYTFKGKGRLQKESAELPEVAFLAIKAYLIADNRWGKMLPDSPIFAGQKPWKPITREQATYRFKVYARQAGLPESCCLHSFRHFAAWELYMFNGHDIVAVQDHLCHKNINMTVNYIKKKQRRHMGNPTVARMSQKYANY